MNITLTLLEMTPVFGRCCRLVTGSHCVEKKGKIDAPYFGYFAQTPLDLIRRSMLCLGERSPIHVCLNVRLDQTEYYSPQHLIIIIA